jgi:hypothetical protein
MKKVIPFSLATLAIVATVVGGAIHPGQPAYPAAGKLNPNP